MAFVMNCKAVAVAGTQVTGIGGLDNMPAGLALVETLQKSLNCLTEGLGNAYAAHNQGKGLTSQAVGGGQVTSQSVGGVGQESGVGRA